MKTIPKEIQAADAATIIEIETIIKTITAATGQEFSIGFNNSIPDLHTLTGCLYLKAGADRLPPVIMFMKRPGEILQYLNKYTELIG